MATVIIPAAGVIGTAPLSSVLISEVKAVGVVPQSLARVNVSDVNVVGVSPIAPPAYVSISAAGVIGTVPTTPSNASWIRQGGVWVPRTTRSRYGGVWQ